ncbi:MAG: phosphoribosylanthranilate isomerase [Geminicoccales bacterium]
MARTRIKICCIGSVDEAELAVKQGVDALGLVGPMPSGPGVIDNGLIAAIAAKVPPPVATFLLTSETVPSAIVDHARACRTNTVQLVDHVAPDDYASIRKELPGVRLVQVIHVEGWASIDEAVSMGRVADALLLDSGRPSAQVRELGGTGRTHDWSLSRAIVEATGCPIFLAGGLRPENVGEAIVQVRPYGVDLCTGVRTDGRLDPIKLNAFVETVERAGLT